MSEHATVKLSEFEVPLIGIPKESTQETCFACGVIMHLNEAVITKGGKVVCPRCAKQLSEIICS